VRVLVLFGVGEDFIIIPISNTTKFELKLDVFILFLVREKK
jgi:hypothetical protein